MLSTAQPSVLKTITQTVVPNATEKRVITLNKHVSRYTKQTLVHGANVSRTTQPTSKQDTITSKCSLLKNNAGLLLNQIKSQNRQVLLSVRSITFSLTDYHDKNKRHFCINTVPFFIIPPVYWINQTADTYTYLYNNRCNRYLYMYTHDCCVPSPCIFVNGSVTEINLTI